MESPARPAARPNNGRVAAICLGITFGMLGLAFASVPFYRWFCAATGYDGTPRIATSGPEGPAGRPIEVRFDTNVFSGLPWRFSAEQGSIRVTTGETVTVMFRMENLSDEETRGVAAFNVTPPLAASHVDKLACFCFSEQVLAPHQTIEAPVTFWVDRSIDGDKNVAGLAGVTLSYTFFAAPSAKPPEPARAAGIAAARKTEL